VENDPKPQEIVPEPVTPAASNAVPAEPRKRRRAGGAFFVVAVVLVAIVTSLVTALLINVFERKQEAKNPYLRVVDVTEDTTDPAIWGQNWPRQYDSYQRTVDATHTEYGGSEAVPKQKSDRDPWLVRMFDGYAFSIDYRDRRGHAFMLTDQEVTRRVTERPQTGACLHCHASVMPTYRRLGDGDAMKGFEKSCAMTYADAHAELSKTADGSKNPKPHPVSCVDCHSPETMELRVTRPGFIRGIAALAASNDPVPHLPSIERWRAGDRKQPYDANRDATRQEMRSFACGQCHVEYYCGPKETLFFPWSQGLKVEQIEATYDAHSFPNGEKFYDWKHGETGAKVLKAQHPEFEMWSQGTHARAGVACADCHMPYQREGAVKVSDHWVRSPLLNMNRACQQCHAVPEQELLGRVKTIQDRTRTLMDRSAAALIDMLDAAKSAKAAGATDEQLKPLQDLQRKAQWRLDFVAAENSMGFHAPQEAARILAESIDYSRQAQLIAAKLREGRPTTQPATAAGR
jgi:nitrite reductase (cytochrome c-552)